ncbi:alpha/beta fold hydrolase [Streptomyces sp. NBC_00687]|uniref:alpha/beta fold hydrolase n=1 Tax=Streptomyces sp. NBC_00687 TaxID=2975807 RepID=UPI00224E0775|nr:alpha/beta hydrolase [Streptomyces sp. NBC_00687]MCX4919046.1 alpha/beta hydrolase [Streptomyces sp. NBC_00687]
MPTMRLKGLDFHYERAGSGPPLLFLNGSGVTLDDARPLVSRLTGHFEVAAFDQRGIGRTGTPREPYTMAELAADAVAVTDRLGWRRYRLLGVSFGGMVAQELAVTEPGRIERLALLCTSSGGAGGSSSALHGDERPVPPARRPGRASGVTWQLRARAGHDVFDRLPRINCPTLVASGSRDTIAPASRGAALADRIPDAVFRVFEGGHLFFLEDPTALPAVTRFLAAG